MNSIRFTKMTAAGNDFVLIDMLKNPSLDFASNLIKNLCDRRFGIGADGVLVISESEKSDYLLQYFNSDGSSGSLCANGSRASALYYYESVGKVKPDVHFEFNGDIYLAQILEENSIKLKLKKPHHSKLNFKIMCGGQLVNASFINTGSPQVVINIKDMFVNENPNKGKYTSLDEVPVYELGRELRYAKEFRPEGTNVNFIETLGDSIKIRSYERGVEEETFACGTGIVAAALVSAVNDNFQPPIKLYSKAGNEFKVDFVIDNQSIKELFLQGTAKNVYTGVYPINL